jgi:hypothetical protein
MTVNEAINLLRKSQPRYIPCGYWVKNDAIIFKTKGVNGLAAPSLFAVTKNHDVYGVTPMMYDLTDNDMQEIF